MTDVSDKYSICYHGGISEITEKKSRFIASVKPIIDEAEAVAFIEEIRKKYSGAKHNCYAYITGDSGRKQKFSDDGEPSQTAGKPMLDILLNKKIRDICVVVTRYFGGTLLGTGGLVRAYQGATNAGLLASTIVIKQYGYQISWQLDYEIYGKIKYIIESYDIPILDTIYTDNILISVMVPEEKEKELVEKINDSSSGRAILTEKYAIEFAKIGEKLIILNNEYKS